PKHFQMNELAQARQLIAENPLSMLVGPDGEGRSFVTHIPMSAGEDERGWWLEGHMARANPHWGWLSGQAEVLAVFTGPDGYVSPRHYETRLAVPTWNYLAVHVYGQLELVDEPLAKDHLLKRLIARHDPDYIAQWLNLPEDYKQKMLAAIVGFRIRVMRWEGKAKVSQNRSAVERERIRANDAELGAWMTRLGA
ncbi:MAG TPA: FMN-binding negative transcriptional regulator, partial [Burkholderiaceae bacterium]